MPGEKRNRKHSPHIQSSEALDGSDVKRRKKQRSGKEKRRRKHVEDVKEGDSRAEEHRTHGDDVRGEVKKNSTSNAGDSHHTKRKSRRKSLGDGVGDGLEPSLEDVQHDQAEKELDERDDPTPDVTQKKKKRKKERRNSEARDDETDIVPNNSPRETLARSDNTDANGVDEKLSDDTPPTNLDKPAKNPEIPLKEPVDDTREPFDKHADGNPTAESKEKKKSKKKKKQGKSELRDEESGIEITKSTAEPRTSVHNVVSENGNPRDQGADLGSSGVKQKRSSDNSAPTAQRRQSASAPKIPSKESVISNAGRTDQPRSDDKNKKRKKRHKSQLGEEESGIERTKALTEARASSHTVPSGQGNQREQSENVDGVKQKLSSDNDTRVAQQETTDQPEDDDKPLDDERLPRTLFVGNVPHTATRKQLHKLFSEYSTIETIRIRNIIPANPKIPKRVALLGHRLAKFSDSFSAYVVFKQTADIEQVLQRAVDGVNMTILQDHHLRVTKALQTKGKRRQSVFIGNLPFDCTDEEVITAFMPVAKDSGVKLMNVRVNRDSDTGVGRGCGFVTFDDILGIQACMNKADDIKIRGRVIRIERAFKTKNMRSKSYKRKRNTVFRPRES